MQWLDASDTQRASYVPTDPVSPALINMLLAEVNAVNRKVMPQHLHKLGYVAEMIENNGQCLKK